MKWFNKLLVTLLALFIFVGVLMRMQIEGQKADIRELTGRVETLEKVIYEMIPSHQVTLNNPSDRQGPRA